MRLMMTEEMQKLWNEITLYYDSSYHLRDDAPNEIKQKNEKLDNLRKKQWDEAMKIELALV
ncbi:MAG: hypothetical protein K2O29_10420 [Ruminococcus sp.]|nr:hypothetical protein [Ruminococcus sp.]